MSRKSNLLEDFQAVARAMWVFRGIAKGRGIRLKGKVAIEGNGFLFLGSRICFHKGAIPTELNTQEEGIIEIGADTMINYGCIFNAIERISIGARCRLGYSVVLLDCHLHHIEPHKRHLRPAAKPIVIEDDVWIGTRAIILPGVRIGFGSVVGAGSIVTQDVPPMTVVAGSPAKAIKRIAAKTNLESSYEEWLAPDRIAAMY